MSYCRSTGKDSDVYLIGGMKRLECFGAGWRLEETTPVHKRILAPDWDTVNGKLVKLDTKHEIADIFATSSRQEMIDHLLEHQTAGHRVPQYAFDRLRKEIAEHGDTY